MENKNCENCIYKVFSNKTFEKEENFKLSVIEISLDNGDDIILDSDSGEWDDCDFDGMNFLVFKGELLVGIYNMNHVISVIVR